MIEIRHFSILLTCITLAGCSDVLERRIDRFSSPPTLELLAYCTQAAIPCGMEHRAGESAPSEYLELNGATGKEILAQLMSRLGGGYKYSRVDGVLNIVPDPPSPSPSLLETPIEKLELENQSLELIQDELNRRIGRTELGGPAVGPIGNQTTPRTITIRLRKTTVREALNSLARKDSRIVWDYCPKALDGKPGITITEHGHAR